MGMNLLPSKYKNKFFITCKIFSKQFICLLVIIFLFGVGQSYFFYRIWILNERLSFLQTNVSNLKPIYNKVQKYKKMEELAQKIGKAKQAWSEILADINAVLDEDIRFMEISKEDDKVIFKGKAINFAAVGDLGVKLKSLKYFSEVNVESSDNVKILGGLNKGDYYSLKKIDRIILSKNIDFIIIAKIKDNVDLFVYSEGGENK